MKVAILYGGKSVEHEISIRSAKNVVHNLDSKITPILIGINKAGKWYLQQTVTESIDESEPIKIDFSSSPATIQTDDGSIKPDAVFPVLHGTNGEDGSVQGLIQCMDIPVVGSGVLGSSVAMDKIVSKYLLQAAGIPVVPFMQFHHSQKEQLTYEEICKTLGSQFMVKAGNLGSSVGVSKVSNATDFNHALEDSFSYADDVLLESFVVGRELECAVIGNEATTASSPGEITIKGDYEFYTYDAKYEDPDAVEIHIPAEIDNEVAQRIQTLSIEAFKACRCEDFARVDVFLTTDNQVFINEINTIPGFTNSSMFPMLWKNEGIDYQTLLTTLIESAIKKWKRSNSLNKDYLAS
jgi:D-alanine-D-alanine ligase